MNILPSRFCFEDPLTALTARSRECRNEGLELYAAALIVVTTIRLGTQNPVRETLKVRAHFLTFPNRWKYGFSIMWL